MIVSGVHIVVDGRVLLVQRPGDKQHPYTWSAVGGKADGHETAVDAIVRETHEEVGIDLDPERLVLLHEGGYDHDGFSFRYSHFIYAHGSHSVELEEDHIGYGWFTHEEALRLTLIADEETMLEKTFAYLEREAI